MARLTHGKVILVNVLIFEIVLRKDPFGEATSWL